jgi:prepilin-type N-terminal cleavage/methylation domain-containing protein
VPERASLPRGFTLLEVVVALAALAVLMGALAIPARGVLEHTRLSRALAELHTLRRASDTWLERGRLDFTGLSVDVLRTEGLLPPAWPGRTPWGGSYGIGPAPGNATRRRATASGLPADRASQLAMILQGQGYPATAAGGVVDVQF